MADRLERSIGAVRDAVHPEWSDAHVGRLITRVRARARRRRVATGAALCVLFLFAGAGVQWALPNPEDHPQVAAGSPLRFADGSVVTLLTPESDIVVERVDAEMIHLRVAAGGGRFSVRSGLPRVFRVSAGDVDVTVVGTLFDVVRDGTEAEVRVFEGRVRVSWPPDGAIELAAGEARRFALEHEVEVASAEPSAERAARGPSRERTPPDVERSAEREEASGEIAIASREEPAIEREASAPRERTERRRAEERPEPRAEADPAWRALAEEGRYDEAAALLEGEVDRIDASDIDGLLLAADTMRLTGRPAIALSLLERAERGATDARAALVAFTKGRLLLTSLSRPGDAAAAFARARQIAPTASFAADALAREVEARSRSGDAAGARERAEEYVRLYPHGVAIENVRRLGGLE
jgi:transmembrane sensor